MYLESYAKNKTFNKGHPNSLSTFFFVFKYQVCKLNFNNPVDATTHMMGRPHDKKMTDWINSYCKARHIFNQENIF